MQCVSRKSKTCEGLKLRCPHKALACSEYCGKHVKAKNIYRFDQSVPLSKKKAKQIIKCVIHGWIIRYQMRTLYGPAWKNPKMINDEMDCVTFELFWTKDDTGVKQTSDDIRPGERFSYVDPWNSRICGFRFSTIQKLAEIKATHPITRLPLPKLIKDICERRLGFMKNHNILPTDLIENDVQLEKAEDFMDLISSRLYEIHINITKDELSNLSMSIINNLYIECCNIWYHTDQIGIRNSVGIPVFNWSRRVIRRQQNSIRDVIFKDIWTVIEKIGDSGCFFFILALGYVHNPIKIRFPYLFM